MTTNIKIPIVIIEFVNIILKLLLSKSRAFPEQSLQTGTLLDSVHVVMVVLTNGARKLFFFVW
jgi:hypothetical protein